MNTRLLSLTCRVTLGIGIAFVTAAASSAEPLPFTDAEKSHWSFQPVQRPTIPSISLPSVSSAANGIDQFLIASQEKQGLCFSKPADKRALLRRVTFDLVGLPPTPEETEEFLADGSPDDYERLVDRLLANPHYGETWGRTWLDVVRFAETAGFNADPARPLAYKYRDYVIRAFNRDLPFDRFLQDQLAGDELFPDDSESLAATGYCRMWPDESNASNIHLARQMALDDLTGNLGSAVLGLSIGCAQCHNHKFDPLLQTDFYQLQAFFSGIVLEDKLPVGSHQSIAAYRREMQKWLDNTAELRHELHEIETAARIKLAGDKRMKFPADVLAAIDCLPEDRSAMQRQLAFWSERQMEYKPEDLPKHIAEDKKARREELIVLLAEAKKGLPKPQIEASVMAVAELSITPPKTHLLETGSYDKPRQELSPHFPVILRQDFSENPPTFTPPSDRSSGRRSALARWLTDPRHPLTHRVWVNRIWQGHFGKGFVDTANDFGIQTPKPLHASLFDWLTSEFTDSGMHAKHLHRLIICSTAYRQSSDAVLQDSETEVDPKPNSSKLVSNSATSPETVDPDNLYLWHFPRQRLTSERIRDAWLASSNNINDAMYGPGVRPELPPNFGGAGGWKIGEPQDRVRRSVYIYAKRNLPYPMMAAFDFPDMHESCGCRTKTTISPQALMLLNSGVIVEAARQLSQRAIQEAGSADPSTQINRAWQIIVGRPASDREIQSALKFLDSQRQIILSSATTPSAEPQTATTGSSPEDMAFSDLCHVLLNSNEFLFVD